MLLLKPTQSGALRIRTFVPNKNDMRVWTLLFLYAAESEWKGRSRIREIRTATSGNWILYFLKKFKYNLISIYLTFFALYFGVKAMRRSQCEVFLLRRAHDKIIFSYKFRKVQRWKVKSVGHYDFLRIYPVR